MRCTWTALITLCHSPGTVAIHSFSSGCCPTFRRHVMQPCGHFLHVSDTITWHKALPVIVNAGWLCRRTWRPGPRHNPNLPARELELYGLLHVWLAWHTACLLWHAAWHAWSELMAASRTWHRSSCSRSSCSTYDAHTSCTV
jgi:hypothetical protein